jgi:ligand-binding SRPBCC domain-containing protein
MKYCHRFRVHAPLAIVADFHSQSSSMPAITPPPVVVRLKKTPEVLAEGDEMEFTMWLGPIPIFWKARIESVSSNGFTDRQLRGPFAEWVHRHSFVGVDETITDVLDELIIKLRLHLFWGPIGLGMVLGLPVLFAFREWKTKRLLKCNTRNSVQIT